MQVVCCPVSDSIDPAQVRFAAWNLFQFLEMLAIAQLRHADSTPEFFVVSIDRPIHSNFLHRQSLQPVLSAVPETLNDQLIDDRHNYSLASYQD